MAPAPIEVAPVALVASRTFSNNLAGIAVVHAELKYHRHEGKPKVMPLPAAEFTRRFLLHVLPSGQQHIRHYGLLANRTRDAKHHRCRELLGVEPPPPAKHDPDEDYLDRYLRLTGVSLVVCPACKHGHMVCIETLLPRPPSQGPPDGRM